MSSGDLCVLLDVLPREVVGRVMRYMDSKTLIVSGAVRKDVLGVFEEGLKGWVKELHQELYDGLLAGRKVGDSVTLDMREPYMGGAQPLDGDFVSVSPLLLSWKMTREESGQMTVDVDGMWDKLVNEAANCFMTAFSNVSLSWEYIEYEYQLFEWPFVKYPADVEAKMGAFTYGMGRVFQCVSLAAKLRNIVG